MWPELLDFFLSLLWGVHSLGAWHLSPRIAVVHCPQLRLTLGAHLYQGTDLSVGLTAPFLLPWRALQWRVWLLATLPEKKVLLMHFASGRERKVR